ncbi:MAG: DUF2617 family protein [Isosphaeraceae bacterium]
MGVRFGRSRVTDLAFRVYNRPLHPDWYSTCAFRRIEFRGWRADVRIIEGGHAVIFRSGSICLSEVLCGPETGLPETGLVFHSHVKHERSAALEPGNSIEYHACFEVEQVDAEIFRNLCEEAACDSGPQGLFHSFRPTNRLSPPPISRIHIDSNSRSLSIQVFHSFPEERAIVRTQSRYEIRR